jgi:hypothetical protein
LINPEFHHFRDYDKEKNVSPKDFYNYNYLPDKVKAEKERRINRKNILEKGEYVQTQLNRKVVLREDDHRQDKCALMK